MPSAADVVRNFPGLYDQYSQVVNNGTWKEAWGGFDQWLSETLARNPQSAEARYMQFGTLPAGVTDVAGQEAEALASEKSYEQELFDQVNRDYIQPDLAQDAQRRTLANELQGQARTDYNTARGLANQALGPSFNAEAYFAANPDVAEAYAKQQAEGGAENTIMGGPMNILTVEQRRENDAAVAAGLPPPYAQGPTPVTTRTPALSPEEFARQHYETTGKAEGRAGGEYTSRLQREYANADQTSQALSDSASTAANEQLAALQDEVEAMRGSLDAETQAKADALQAQIASLTANIDSYDTAQKAALTDEITKLTAAQLPVSAARVAAAENLVSSINLGLEQTRDQLASDQAAMGFVGGGSSQNASLLRATLGARQNAAQVRSQADLANAEDIRTIDARGATGGRAIADSTASNRFGLGNYGATTTYGDTLADASGRRTLTDALASGSTGIRNNLSTQQQSARDAGSARRAGYFDADYTRSLGTALTLPSLTTNYTNSVNALDQYKNAGLNRSLDTLNWWAGGGQAPQQQTAQYQAYADQAGNTIAGLASGLTGAAINIGNANQWWQRPGQVDAGKVKVPTANNNTQTTWDPDVG